MLHPLQLEVVASLSLSLLLLPSAEFCVRRQLDLPPNLTLFLTLIVNLLTLE